MSELRFNVDKSSEIPARLQLIDIFQLTEAQDSVLKERIKNSDGVLEVLVHPYFGEMGVSSQELLPVEYRRKRDKIITDSLDLSFPPLLIFEEEEEKDLLAQRLPRGLGDIYVLSTQHQNPTPQVEYLQDHIAWDILGKILDDLGVKRVSLGGRYFNEANLEHEDGVLDEDTLARLRVLREKSDDKPYAQEWLKKNFLPYGCAGTAAQQLLTLGFDVAFSSATSPDHFESSLK